MCALIYINENGYLAPFFKYIPFLDQKVRIKKLRKDISGFIGSGGDMIYKGGYIFWEYMQIR